MINNTLQAPNKNSEHIYYVKASIVGPYLPKNKQVIEDYIFINEQIDQSGWENGPTGLKATPSKGSCGITLSYNIKTKNSAEIILKVKTDSLSSRIAKEIAEVQVKNLCALLSIAVPGCRYFYKMSKVKMLPDANAHSNIESPLSEPLFGISYEKKKIENSEIEFIREVMELVIKDSVLEEAISYFSKALQAEFYQSVLDEKAVLFYFKILELLSPKILKKYKLPQEEKNNLYEKAITTIISKMNEQKNWENKLKDLRQAFSEIKQIDGSIISENIKSAATKIGFQNDGILRLTKMIEMRNEIIAHANKGEKKQITLEDDRDFREIAKIFIKAYINLNGIETKDIESIETTKEIGGWYMVAYTKSGK